MLTALLILASATPQTTDPLAQARAGKVQCVGANEAAKTCMAMGIYTVKADGSFDTVTTVVIAPTPLITMTVKSTGGMVKGNALCAPIKKSEFEAAEIKMDGGPANEAMAAAIRPQLLAAVSAMDGKMSCGTEAADGTINVTLDGVAAPEMTQKAKWVSPSEGYKLGM